MNRYNREQLMYIFGYSFEILSSVRDLNKAIENEQQAASSGVMDNYSKIKKIYDTVIIIFTVIVCIASYDGIFTKIGMMIAMYLMFKLLFFPFIFIVKMLFSGVAKKNYKAALYSDKANEYRSRGLLLLQDENFLKCKEMIPKRYFNIDDLYTLYIYLQEYRADNFKEAVNLLAEENHRSNVEFNQRMAIQKLTDIEKNIKYQTVINTIQLLETQAINDKLSRRKKY